MPFAWATPCASTYNRQFGTYKQTEAENDFKDCRWIQKLTDD